MDLIAPPQDRRLHPGDVLLVSRGEKNRACLVLNPPPDGMGIASNVFLVLRPDPGRVVPAYLAWLLNQAPIQDVIRRDVRTSSVSTPMVRSGDLAKLRVPVPDLAQQQRIADLAGLMQRETVLRHRLAELSEQRNRLVGAHILTSHVVLRNSP